MALNKTLRRKIDMALSNKNKTSMIIVTLLFATVIMPITAFTQHVGDNLLYQGLAEQNSVSAKAAAYGNAFTSRTGDLSSLFFNSAGLVDIKSFQISFSAATQGKMWRDNQQWYAGTAYRNVPLYLDGLWEPDPAWDGIWSDSLMQVRYDSLGNPVGTAWDVTTIKDPVYGKDVYSKERADNEYTSDKFSFDNIALAVPFQLVGKQWVAAGSYHKRYDVHDYDWNGTHLNPTWHTSEITIAAPGDTTRTDWSVYTRERTGGVYSINGALAMELNKYIQLGIGFNRFAGETDDKLMLDRVGYFLTEHQGENWAFSHESHLSKTTGMSKFSSLQFNIGSIIKLDNFNFGFNVKLPYTVEREWNYATVITTTRGSTSYDSSGVDKVDIPATYNFGLTFKPYNKLTLSLDFEKTNYSKTTYNLDETFQDSLTLYTKWVDQFSLGFGVEYNLTKFLTVLAGYQSRTTPFIPYGVAIKDRGPSGETYSIGFSLNALWGRFDVSYNYYHLKYYDAFFTNNNYTLQSLKKLSFGYTIFL